MKVLKTSLHAWRKSARTTKLLASLAVLGAAASIAGLGTYATFTSSATASHTVSSGTVTIALGAVGPANRLTVGASNVAAGDTIQRAFDLSDTGSIDLASFTFTTTASPSTALDTDATNGLQMVIDRCSAAWTESGPPYTYTCSGTTSSVVASRAVIGSNISMSNVSDLLTAGAGPDHLRLTLTLPSGAGNTLQTLSSTLTYTFTGTQRAATDK
jgi:predicted ribosomally synthesized peptide with SipW-like signal peptide